MLTQILFFLRKKKTNMYTQAQAALYKNLVTYKSSNSDHINVGF